jgi:chemotaxis receptor (MCP) glutamine deamidase CheD
MQKLAARVGTIGTNEIRVGVNECRLAKQSERLVARDVLADVVVTVQVPAAGFAAMLRFSVPEEASVSRQRLEGLWDFADQALALLFESIRSMELAPEQIAVSAIGGAEVVGRTFGRGKQLASAVRRSLWKQGVVLKGTDLGGTHSRVIWLESDSGRLIVRSASPWTKGSNAQSFQEVKQSRAS